MKKLLLLVFVVFAVTSFKPKERTWVAIGDSITYLNEHLDETGYRVSKGYMTLVTERLTNLHYTNQGHNGWTVIRIAKEIEKLGLEKADIYSVFLGTNDWWAGLPLGVFDDYSNSTGTGTVYGAYRIIIDKIRSLNPNASIILITPMQRADFVYVKNMKNNAYGSYKEKNGQTLAQFAEAVNTIGRHEHFKVVDLYNKSGMTINNLVKYKRLKDPQTGVYKNYPYPDFTNIPFNPEADEYPYPAEAIDMTYDGLHPSDKGNQVIADMLISMLKK